MCSQPCPAWASPSRQISLCFRSASALSCLPTSLSSASRQPSELTPLSLAEPCCHLGFGAPVSSPYISRPSSLGPALARVTGQGVSYPRVIKEKWSSVSQIYFSFFLSFTHSPSLSPSPAPSLSLSPPKSTTLPSSLLGYPHSY